MTDVNERIHRGQVLHAVVAEQGEYSSWTLWTVALYLDRATAERHAALAQAWQEERERLENAMLDGNADFNRDAVNPWDACTGAGYWDRSRRYTVAVEFVLQDPDHHVAEYQTMLDYAKEQGWVP